MNDDNRFQDDASNLLRVKPPYIWPEARVQAGFVRYEETPPSRKHLANADLISGLLVGAADETIRWLGELMADEVRRRICLVLVLFPAGPTREKHLQQINILQSTDAGGENLLDIRLLPVTGDSAGDYQPSFLPPTVVQAHCTRTGQTIMSIGSVANAGGDIVVAGSLNLVFSPDDALRDAWRQWFQYLFATAAQLNEDTARIPHLVPAKGDPEASRLWEEFEEVCLSRDLAIRVEPTIDPATGEIEIEVDGQPVPAWDAKKTALEPLARVFQEVYASGWLVTVDETTRIKPLSIPVKATLLGQKSERTVGAITQTQSFTLKVLDDSVDKQIEKCRKVTDVMELLTYPLSQGNRWLPERAKSLLEKELESRNERGKVALREALGGTDIEQFVANRTNSIRTDLNEMYQQLRQGTAVPKDKLNAVLDEVKQRLKRALQERVAPRAVYNRISAPDLTTGAPDENWRQPLSLLESSARALRKLLTDSYFPRRFKGLSFSEDDFRKACDVFGDVIVATPETDRAENELSKIDEIINVEKLAKEKCQEIWRLISGEQPEPRRQ